MSMMSEFKDFAMKGNVVDMAVGVVIGGAFKSVVTSFTNDILMPPIGLLLGGVDFSSLSLTIKEAGVRPQPFRSTTAYSSTPCSTSSSSPLRSS